MKIISDFKISSGFGTESFSEYIISDEPLCKKKQNVGVEKNLGESISFWFADVDRKNIFHLNL